VGLRLIFVLGVAAITEFFLIWLSPAFAILAFSAVLLIPVMIGFAIRDNGWFLLSLPAVPISGKPMMDGMFTAQYPQVFLFRIGFRNLYLLYLATLYGVALLVLVLTRRYQAVFNNPIVIAYEMLLAGYALIVTLVWVKERRLLELLRVALGRVDRPPIVSFAPQVSYQYFDWGGERRGGVVRFHHLLMSKPDLFTPVFFDPTDADSSKPGFAFWFHRFAIVDSRHTVTFLAEQAKRLQGCG
jgi:hypothetical protein